jgi:hypothetical protein
MSITTVPEPVGAPPARFACSSIVRDPVSASHIKSILSRRRFIGRVHPRIVALLVPIETALAEVQHALGFHAGTAGFSEASMKQPELSRGTFLSLLNDGGVVVIRDVEHFVRLKEML